jgi:predicted phage terminase large subunit-like protein
MREANKTAHAVRSGRATASTPPSTDDGAAPVKPRDYGKPRSRKLNESGKALLAAYMGASTDPVEAERVKLVRACRATVHSRVMAAREDPDKFVEYCFHDSETGRPMRQAKIHRDLQASMASGDDCVNLLPRDHGKTTQTEAHALWRLGNNPALRIKIVCASDSKAVERLFAIIQHIRTNDRVRSVFPWLRPAGLGDWTKHKIVVDRPHISRDASIEALGVLSTATGGRCDLLFADDVVDRRNALELPKLRETIKSAWDSDWSNLLEPHAQSIYNATPWHVSDLTHKLIRNPTYRVMRRPVGTAKDPYRPVWKEKWDRPELKRRKLRIGEMEYARGFRLVALSGEFATVRPEFVTYWDAPPDLGALRVFQAFDVSSGEAADYFAAVTVGVDPATRIIYVLDAWHDKLTFLGRAGAVARERKRWHPNAQGIEDEAMKSLRQFLDEATLLDTIPLRPTLSKAVRLMGVTPYMERNQVAFNPALHPDRIVNAEETGDLVTELTEFPLGAHDDLVDAYVHAINLAAAYGGADEEDRAVQLGVSVIGGGNGAGAGLLDVPDDGGNGAGNGGMVAL